MITKTDRRRFRLYNKKKDGYHLYSIEDIAEKEGVSRQAIYQSLRKFGEDFKKRKRPRTWL